jgi:sulfur carrier protein ThiS
MSAIFILRDQKIPTEAGQSLLQALKKANIRPETVLAVRNGEMISGETIIHENDQIRLIRTISGGSNPNPTNEPTYI